MRNGLYELDNDDVLTNLDDALDVLDTILHQFADVINNRRVARIIPPDTRDIYVRNINLAHRLSGKCRGDDEVDEMLFDNGRMQIWRLKDSPPSSPMGRD